MRESMDIDSPSSSSSPSSNESFSENPDVNGFLYLHGNPGPWIENNPIASHLLLKHLLLDFSDTEQDHQEIDDSIQNLSRLTQLTICGAKSLKCLPVSIAKLQSLRHLTFRFCDFKELPAHIGLLKMNLTQLTLYGCFYIKFLPKTVATLSKLTCLDIGRCFYLTGLPPCLGQLRSLTDLTLQGCYAGFLTQSIAALSNLTSLHLSHCDSLTELPASLGQLGSLKHLSLKKCCSLKSLPNAMSNLLELETLYIEKCSCLTELPANLKVTYLQLIDSSIRSIPRGLFNLLHLEVAPSYSIPYENLKDSVKLQILTINDALPDLNATLNKLVNLQILCFHRLSNQSFIGTSHALEGLQELVLLDIQYSSVNYLSWNIMKLRKLRFLILPWDFRLPTLPFHLNDSLIISVQQRHIRKPWKQLKQEIGISPFPFAQGESSSTIAPPGYLSLNSDLEQWIRDNYESRFLVKMLELDFSRLSDDEVAKNSIEELRNLTHLFVTFGFKKDCIPHTVKDLKHVSLEACYIESYSDSLGKLSNLETLDLIDLEVPETTKLPVSIRHLSLRPNVIPYSVPANIAKLPNLRTLDLSGCHDLTSLPTIEYCYSKD